jgi:antitoxin HicB
MKEIQALMNPVAATATVPSYRDYRMEVKPNDDGSLFIRFPDLPGCMTEVEDWHEIPAAAQEAVEGWVLSEQDMGRSIPGPRPTTYSGNLHLRIPPSLHNLLADQAHREGVSVNLLATSMLSQRVGECMAGSPRVVNTFVYLLAGPLHQSWIGEVGPVHSESWGITAAGDRQLTFAA